MSTVPQNDEPEPGSVNYLPESRTYQSFPLSDREAATIESIKADTALRTAQARAINQALERNTIATQVHTAKLECAPIAIATGFNLPVALVCGTALAISGRGVLGWSLILMVICLEHLPRFIRDCYPAKT